MRWWLRAVCVLTVAVLAYVGSPPRLLAEGIENLKNGVVKITAQVDGKTKTGTGFIVRLEKETAYIITASHVVEGDPQPKVVFRSNDTKVFPSHIKGLEGDERRGLAALVVNGNLPAGLETLPLNQDFHVTGGEEGIVIGFPLVPAVPWAVTSSVMTGQHGKYLVFSGAAVEGNSGGPLMVAGKVVGVVTEVSGQYGYAVPIPIVRLALRGWGIPLGAAPKETTRVPEIAKGQQSRTIQVLETMGHGDDSTKIVFYKSTKVNLERVPLQSTKIAGFDSQHVMESSRAGRAAIDSLRSYSTSRQTIINADEAELRHLEESVKAGKKSFEPEFRNKLGLYQSRVRAFNAELEERRKVLVDLYTARLEIVAQRVGERDGWDLILENLGKNVEQHKDSLALDLANLLKQGIPNITPAIVEEFDRLYQ